MCGRFAQYDTREHYLDALGVDDDQLDIPYDPEPLERYNVAPGTKVLLLNWHDDALHLDPVLWGYAPGWWDKQPLINARVETAATGRMFKPLWNHGRAVVFADGWYEWKRDGNSKQPYFIYQKSREPLFFAAIGSAPFERGDPAEGFVIVTAESDAGMVDIHDRRPLVLRPDAIAEWLHPDTTGVRASEIAHDAALPANAFTWHAVSKAVGSPKNQGAELIEPLSDNQ